MDPNSSMHGFLNNENSDALALPYKKYISRLRASFPSNAIRHKDYHLILQSLTRYYYKVNKMMQEEHKDHCEYTFCGMMSTYIYPSGQTSKVTEIGRFFLVWAYIDDVIDASRNIDEIMTICASLKRTTLEPPHIVIHDGMIEPEIYGGFSEFFNTSSWDADALSMAKSTFLQYIDHTMLYRKYEIEQRTMWTREYFISRSFNTGMPVVQVLRWYANPELDVRALREEGIKDAILLSGRLIGLTLDMFDQNIKRPNETTFAHLYSILQNNFGLNHDDALHKVAEVLDESQAEFSAQIQRVSSKFSQESEGINETNYNSLRWILDGTTRYKQKN